MKQELARSTVQTTAVLVLRILTQGAILIASARLLGPGTYGVYVAATALAAVLGILPCLGSGFVMLARPDPGPSAASEVWRYAWPLSLATGLVLCLLYVPLASALGGSHPLPLRVLWLIAAMELLITPIGVLLSNTLQAVHQVPLSQLALWASLALRGLFMVPFFFATAPINISTFVCLQAAAAVLGLLVIAAFAQRRVKLNGRPRLISFSEFKSGASYSVMHLMAANTSEIDKVVAASAIGSHDAGIYSATARVIGAALTPISALLLSAQPQLFRYREKPLEQIRRLLVTIGASALVWGCISWAALSCVSPIITTVLGPPYQDVENFLPWLATIAGPVALRMSAGTILVAMGKPSVRIRLEITGTVAMLCLIGILGPPLGLYGMTVAVASVEALMAAVGWWLVSRTIGR